MDPVRINAHFPFRVSRIVVEKAIRNEDIYSFFMINSRSFNLKVPIIHKIFLPNESNNLDGI